MLTLRQLRYFHTLRETLHFGRAAKRLNISQPALSAQIAHMEEFFGGPLFLRGTGGVTMTADGARIAERVRRILTDVQELEDLAVSGERLLSRRLRLGIIASAAPYLLPPLLAELKRSYGDLQCEVRESLTDRLIAEMDNGELDCAIVALPIEEAGLEALALFDDPFFLAVPETEAGRLVAPVAVNKIQNERLILLEEGHCLRAQTLQVCQVADPAFATGLSATSLTTILRMVAGGLGSTLIPRMAIADEIRGGGIAILPFVDPAPMRTMALAYRPSSTRRRDFEILAQLIREVGATLHANLGLAGLQGN